MPRAACHRSIATGSGRDPRPARDVGPLRVAGALRPAVRSHALALAASLRARARREPRPRPAMVDLKRLYEQHGLFMSSSRLPDYLPRSARFCPRSPRRRRASAARRDGAYPGGDPAAPEEAQGALLLGVLRGPGAERGEADGEVLKAILAEPDDPNDLAALDAAWRDEEVTFGPGAASACGTGGIAAKIQAARRPAPDLGEPVPQRPLVTVTRKAGRRRPIATRLMRRYRSRG